MERDEVRTEPAGAMPVMVEPHPAHRRFRWGIAISVVAIVALISVVGAFMLSGAGGAARSLTAGNAPSETLVFVDLRTDLPGDQHQKLADLMTHFPGFKDRAQFENGFDEVLNRITSQISPQLTYTSAFKGWAAGEVSLAVTDLGLSLSDVALSALASLGAQPTPAVSPSGCLIAALKDRAAGEKWVASEAARSGLTFASSEYAGTTVFESQSGTPATGYAFTDRVFIAGTLGCVKAGLDAPRLGSLAESAGYQESMKVLRRDSIARFYIDTGAVARNVLADLDAAIKSAYGLVGLDAAEMSGWISGSVRAESYHLEVEIAVSGPAQSSSGNRDSVMARLLPASTVAVVEARSVGSVFTRGFELLAGSGTQEQKELATQIGKTLDSIGGIGWIGDSDFVVTREDGKYSGGLVVKTTDPQTAADKKTMLTNLLALASAGLSSPIGPLTVSSSEETYKGASVNRYTIGDGTTSIAFSIAARGDLLFAGLEDTFVKQMLDTAPGASLADQGRYRALMAIVGPTNSGFGYLDVAAIVDDLGHAALGSDAETYDLYYAPYLENMGAIGYSVFEGQTVILRLVVTAK